MLADPALRGFTNVNTPEDYDGQSDVEDAPMSPRMPTPVQIGSVVDRIFRITWSDGHRSTYSWRALRLACPCAHCRGEWPVRRSLDSASIPDDLRAMRIDRVGAYALRFTWWGGHDTGLHPFTLLRFDLCECEECRTGGSTGSAR